MLWLSLVWLFIGIVALVVGGDWLVRGAGRLAQAAGVSPLVAGLTVVAFATSAPELVVSLRAALGGDVALAVGNVTGSNIANVGLILGAAALLAPLHVPAQLARVDVRVMAVVFGCMWALGADGAFAATDGLLLVGGLAAHLIVMTGMARRADAQTPARPDRPVRRGQAAVAMGWVVAGVGLLLLGADRLVTGAVDLAQWAGVSERLIGLTVVALGTSLPELAASLAATVRGEREIAVGNVIGSNVFNILGVLGVTALAAPTGLPVAPQALALDLPAMMIAGLICLWVCSRPREIRRWEGAAMLSAYALYMLSLAINR